MLLRLHVDGFKNISNIDAWFGPLTCFAGANAVGKSNLFDALIFLRDLANFPILEAAARVRDPLGRSGDPTALFFRSGRRRSTRLKLIADIIVPREVEDDFGRSAKPQATFLRYELEFALGARTAAAQAEIQLEREQLQVLSRDEALHSVGFIHSDDFFKSVFHGKPRKDAPIATEREGEMPVVVVRDQQGRPFKVPARNSPRTVLGGTNSNSHPTILAARREMQSWQLLQLEPSALRRPDDFSADPHLSETGEHLPATLHRLANEAAVANRLSELVPDIVDIRVDEDPGRRQRTVAAVVGRDRAEHAARSLSDGTLRFLALAVLSVDPQAARVICMEEPENGIHPARIAPLLKLLGDMAVDPHAPVGDGNMLRQVVMNTHSPIVVSLLPADDVVFVQGLQSAIGKSVTLYALPETWRAQDRLRSLPPGVLTAYLTGLPPALRDKASSTEHRRSVFDLGRQLGLTLEPEDDQSAPAPAALHAAS